MCSRAKKCLEMARAQTASIFPRTIKMTIEPVNSIFSSTNEMFIEPASTTPSHNEMTDESCLDVGSVVEVHEHQIIQLEFNNTSETIENNELLLEETLDPPLDLQVPENADNILSNDCEYGDMQDGRLRSKKANDSNWKQNKNKQLRMQGLQYLGYTRKNKIIKQDTIRKARVIGASCSSEYCKKSSKRFCSTFTEANRTSIFENFWTKMDWSQRKVFVCNHVQQLEVSRRQIFAEHSRRSQSFFFYFLPSNEKGSNIYL